MKEASNWKTAVSAMGLLLVVCGCSAFGQKLAVTIVDRQDNVTDYTYVVPTQFTSQSSSSGSCDGTSDEVKCRESTTTTGNTTPTHVIPYHVRGATFSLQLPDGRLVIVNCESKFAERLAGHAGNHRNCRRPIVDNIEAEFHGDKVKLEWVVSLDGKKMQSETYNVLAVLGKPASEHR